MTIVLSPAAIQAALAVIDAQAATLERVRAILFAPGVYADKLRDARSALGPAPAQAEPDPFARAERNTEAMRADALGKAPAQAEPVLRQRGKSAYPEMVALRERAEAAEARCAELERELNNKQHYVETLEAQKRTTSGQAAVLKAMDTVVESVLVNLRLSNVISLREVAKAELARRKSEKS